MTMKTEDELKALASSIYWDVEHGDSDSSAKKLMQLQIEALRWAVDQVIPDGNPDNAREKIMGKIFTLHNQIRE